MKTYDEYMKLADQLHKTALMQSFLFRDKCEEGAQAVRELANFREKISAQAKEAVPADPDRIKGHWIASFICPVCGEHSRHLTRECPFCHTIMIETEDKPHG